MLSHGRPGRERNGTYTGSKVSCAVYRLCGETCGLGI
jgi:hypothetical protein